MGQRRSHQATGTPPRPAVKNSGDAGHQKISIVRNRRSVVQMRRPKDHRRNDQADPRIPCRMFDPVLNQAAEQELLRQRREQENPREQRRHGIKLRVAETVGNKSNRQAQRDRNRGEQQEIRQSGAQDVAVGFETVSDVGHPIPHSKRDDSCVDREKLRKRVVQVRTRGCNQDSANNPKLQRQPYPQNNQRLQPQTASHVSHRPESDKRYCQVYRHRDHCRSSSDVHADGVDDIQQPQSRRHQHDPGRLHVNPVLETLQNVPTSQHQHQRESHTGTNNERRLRERMRARPEPDDGRNRDEKPGSRRCAGRKPIRFHSLILPRTNFDLYETAPGPLFL